jgi:hypothetical protein
MVKYCSECGNGLEKDTKFCSECGTEIKEIIEAKTPATPKKTEKQKTKKKASPKMSFPKLQLKLPKVSKKAVLAVVAVFCLVAVATTLVVMGPFDMTSTVVKSSIGGRTFDVTIVNECDSDAECCFKVGALNYNGLDSFAVPAGEEITVEIVEDYLEKLLLREDYDITLKATVDYEVHGIASGVTESATFVINTEDGLAVEATTVI